MGEVLGDDSGARLVLLGDLGLVLLGLLIGGLGAGDVLDLGGGFDVDRGVA